MPRLLALLLLPVLLSAADPLVDPPRVRNSGGTSGSVVAADGSLLRGPAVWTYKYGKQIGLTAYATDPAYYQSLRANGANAVRVLFYDPDQRKNGYVHYDLAQPADVAEILANLDRIVDLCAEHGLQAMINFHEPGAYNDLEKRKATTYPQRDYMFTFWKLIAPRYAKRTHVFYELMNEPKWYAEQYGSDQVLEDTRALFDQVRADAPDTHLVLLSFANTHDYNPNVGMINVVKRLDYVDWTKAAVGFHPYNSNRSSQAIVDLMKTHPVINTEMNLPPSEGGDGNAQEMDGEKYGFQTMERLKISWFSWQTEGPAKFSANWVGKIKADAEAKGYWWGAPK